MSAVQDGALQVALVDGSLARLSGHREEVVALVQVSAHHVIAHLIVRTVLL